MKEGSIKWYSPEKGYGFINTGDMWEKESYFFHKSNVIDMPMALNPQTKVSFSVYESPKGLEAKEVKVL